MKTPKDKLIDELNELFYAIKMKRNEEKSEKENSLNPNIDGHDRIEFGNNASICGEVANHLEAEFNDLCDKLKY